MAIPHSERVARYLAKHPGATIAEARGHGKTPERPGQGREEERFREYYEKRENLERQVEEKKRQDFEASDKWRSDRSERNLKNHPARIADMQLYLSGGLEALRAEPDFDWQDERWAWLRYH